MKQEKQIVGLYMRLSQEDERSGESLSIENQRHILRKYCEERGLDIYDEYIDDGVSGTTFDRPEVQRLLDDAKTGVINTIIVKDLSLEPHDLVRVDHGWREAGKRPSRSALLHKMIYEKHPEINAVVVAQPTNILAFGITRTEIDSRTIPESYIKIRDLIRLPYGTNITSPEDVVNSLGKRHPVILIENDSVIAVGKTLIEAFDALEVVEFTANTLIHSGLIGQAVRITDEEVKVINKEFKLD